MRKSVHLDGHSHVNTENFNKDFVEQELYLFPSIIWRQFALFLLDIDSFNMKIFYITLKCAGYCCQTVERIL
jgi:hypothetical protein